ncbi:4'-phosphopantetheinyl transferase superfamily protein [Lachnospiraceae bacterium]|nr:4'-phosphopantetheinyl transferase superfamily protein [Lachnospiraceae bacterium]
MEGKTIQMQYRTVVYYTFCPAKEMSWKEYKKYQRNIADRMLAYGFCAQFGLGYDPKLVERGTHGKPFWTGRQEIYFNVSNTAGLVVCALSDLETGVDAEHIRAVKPAVVRRCCTESEIDYIKGTSGENREEEAKERFFQLWTLKESFIKMTGQGMYFPMKEAAFSIRNTECIQEILCTQAGYFTQKRVGDYWLSLCTESGSKVVWKELALQDLRESWT